MIVMATIVLIMNACTEAPGLKSALGDYRYTISGSVRVYVLATDSSYQARLTPENGTMTITRGEEKDEAKISIWSNNGDTYDLTAVINHDTIYIEQSYRDIYVDEVKELFSIGINGTGMILSNGDISLSLYYNGRAHNAEYVLTGSGIKMLARKE